MTIASPTSTESKALSLLGYGCGPEHTAAACGVEVSRISQLLSDANFAAQVAELRFQHLSKHNERDNRLDSLEDELITKLELLKDLMCNPMQVLKALQVINGAKRRGASAPEMLGTQQTVVTLSIPITVIRKFETNINNQVVIAGNQELVTIPSATLLDSVKQKLKEALPHGSLRTSKIGEITAATI